ncbi:MAG: penicillin-binding transpeptidase domain-containing protein, partial [Myxococcota bacterium]
GIEYEPRRTYPAGRMAGALLGFADIDGRGRRGIEQMMDEWLRGEPQQLAVERDARGRLLGRVAVDPRLAAGGDVVLTLDSGLQAQAEAALAEVAIRSRSKTGLVIAVEPKTGDILTLAEWPGFDPNEFRSTPYAQTRSRAFHDALEPGSTIKAFLIAAALENETVTARTSIDTGEGWVRIPGKTIRDHHPYGVLDPVGVLRYSSNVGAIWIGEQLGAQAYHEALTRLGFGRPTKSGFPSESAGLLRDWQKWRSVDQATASFGQGLNVTPIQLAMATAALANDGQLMQPRLVMARRSALGDWENQPPRVAGQALDTDSARRVLAMLESVVSAEGTGRRAALAGIRVAGKTGTAQHLDSDTGRYSRSRYTAWFVGAAPADDPKVVVVVALEEPRGIHSGGAIAAPLFATVATSQLARHGIMTQPEPIPAPAVPTWRVAEEQRMAEKKALAAASALAAPAKLAPSRAVSGPPPRRTARARDSRASVSSADPLRTVLVPDFHGVSVSSAHRLAASETLDLHITGAAQGEVIGQAPPAGTVVVGRHRTVQLRVARSREGG